jgi:meso-butanediol dehydrogenase/(S,S)-butanediol dehydrogenase/diacetyl reductase
MRFQGKTVVVTGSGGGIGARTVQAFTAEGADVVVTDINLPAAQRVAAAIPGALALETDVTSPAALRSMVDQVTGHFGSIDVFINNAMSCSETPFLDAPAEEIQRDIAVSLTGPIFACQAVLPGMLERGGGVILNVASVNGMAYFGNEAYSAAKAGLINLTQSLAVQFGAHGIRCNAVAPGTVATEHWEARRSLDPQVFDKAARWYPLGRIGQPEDIAQALLFLASDDAAWITGVTLPVEGGVLAGNLEMARAITPVREEHPANG